MRGVCKTSRDLNRHKAFFAAPVPGLQVLRPRRGRPAQSGNLDSVMFCAGAILFTFLPRLLRPIALARGLEWMIPTRLVFTATATVLLAAIPCTRADAGADKGEKASYAIEESVPILKEWGVGWETSGENRAARFDLSPYIAFICGDCRCLESFQCIAHSVTETPSVLAGKNDRGTHVGSFLYLCRHHGLNTIESRSGELQLRSSY